MPSAQTAAVAPEMSQRQPSMYLITVFRYREKKNSSHIAGWIIGQVLRENATDERQTRRREKGGCINDLL